MNELPYDALTLTPTTSDEFLFGKIIGYINLCRRQDLSGLVASGPEDKTQFTRRHNALKKKGGNPPIDYSAIEMLNDLELAVQQKNRRQALILYAQLNRILPA